MAPCRRPDYLGSTECVDTVPDTRYLLAFGKQTTTPKYSEVLLLVPPCLQQLFSLPLRGCSIASAVCFPQTVSDVVSAGIALANATDRPY